MKISNSFPILHDEIQFHCGSNSQSFIGDSCSRKNKEGDSSRNWKANHQCENNFGKCLSYGKFHTCNSCAFRDAKCFKRGKLICRITIHFASSVTKPCNLGPKNSAVPYDHLSISNITSDYIHPLVQFMTSL
ncbi:unnamed protein product [Schistosoma curassoni]|uniref:ShKT domain-containing protein n=1 Tax=Schistosoma curassoni TaxID=6186 RepID=A0A183JRE4_9TREM|nr:unnamed protein product [Schistosoma curassoni]